MCFLFRAVRWQFLYGNARGKGHLSGDYDFIPFLYVAVVDDNQSFIPCANGEIYQFGFPILHPERIISVLPELYRIFRKHYRLLLRPQYQPYEDKLSRPEFPVLVFRSGSQERSSGFCVDSIFKEAEFADPDRSAVHGFHFNIEFSGSHGRPYPVQFRLRNGEIDINGINGPYVHQGGAGVCRDRVSRINHPFTGYPVHGGDDVTVTKIDSCSFNICVVKGYLRLVQSDICHILFKRLFGYDLFLDQRPVAFQVVLIQFELRLILFKLRKGLVEIRLVRGLVDCEKLVGLFHILAFLKEGFHDFSGDLGNNVHIGDHVDVAE